MKPLVIGSRGSPLALAQVDITKALLRQALPALPVEVKIIKTSGDIFQAASLTQSAGKGLFTKEIEEQLLDGSIDLAVHSLKDLPTELPAGLVLGGVPAREDARDVLISKQFSSFADLPNGALVATSSIRRKAQLLARRPDLRIQEIRGNVGTRLQKLADNPDLAATILAAAGIKRLGLWEKLIGFRWELLGLDLMLPAVGQGIIGYEIREGDNDTRHILAAIGDTGTLACATAERAFLRALGGGCQVPYAAHATLKGDTLKLIGAVFSHDGQVAKRTEVAGPVATARELGEQAAAQCR